MATKTTNKGGLSVSALIIQLRKTDTYFEWKKAVHIRDRFTCQKCGRRNGRKPIIEAHHLIEFSDLVRRSGVTSVAEGVEHLSLWDINNGQTLCHDCHKGTPSYPKGFATGKKPKRSMDWRYKPNKQKGEEQL